MCLALFTSFIRDFLDFLVKISGAYYNKCDKALLLLRLEHSFKGA